ncbi:hypothetical protein AVEN_182743-1 [Araneus ventricosus]|uniref:CRAL/TRIO N-terminal domain-containing protein n=1 Tax=Araneus ventricosus TaxID=182803 RepID=A0A4Y2N366_ARAVE|nr:hypothetical protein AVEN_182743-1 [Araneus ventricosus]
MDDFLPYKMVNIDHPSLLPNLKEINEFAETKAECLEMLRRELISLQDIEPCLEENFLLRFLRVSKFNTSKALQRILKYYQQQEIFLDSLKKNIPTSTQSWQRKPSLVFSLQAEE